MNEGGGIVERKRERRGEEREEREERRKERGEEKMVKEREVMPCLRLACAECLRSPSLPLPSSPLSHSVSDNLHQSIYTKKLL